ISPRVVPGRDPTAKRWSPPCRRHVKAAKHQRSAPYAGVAGCRAAPLSRLDRCGCRRNCKAAKVHRFF
ncbi:MAG: hypothetical protein IKD22_00080, partial [Lentisphaeria bacterium]|nr:hypothetical protein [Lentisphaeria bacterium]